MTNDNALTRLRRKLDEIIALGESLKTEKIARSPTLMVKGPSPMFKTEEQARQAMANPDIILAKQEVSDRIKRILRD